MKASVEPDSSFSASPPQAITERDVQGLLDRFIRAYEVGDADTLAELFAQHAVTSEENGREAIHQAYAKLFRETKTRTIQIRNPSWKGGADTALLSLDLSITVQGAETAAVPKRFERKAEITLNKQGSTLLIVRFNYGMERQDLALGTGVKTLSKSSLDEHELRGLLDQFVRAYERGDAETFAGLFAKDAVTSEEAGQAAIYSAYKKVFLGTTRRTLTIHSLSIKDRDGFSIMSFHLTITTTLKGVKSVSNRFAGQAEIAVERIDNAWGIIRFTYALEPH
jgi:uncharacterized protein (TIGR02246 family)